MTQGDLKAKFDQYNTIQHTDRDFRKSRDRIISPHLSGEPDYSPSASPVPVAARNTFQNDFRKPSLVEKLYQHTTIEPSGTANYFKQPNLVA